MEAVLLQLTSHITQSGYGSDLAAAARGASMLDPGAEQAAEVAKLWWFFFSICTAVFVGVIVATVLSVWRGRGHQSAAMPPPAVEKEPRRDQGLVFGVSSAVTLTILLLFVLLVRDFFTDRVLGTPSAPDALTIRLTGHQWWWDVEYEDLLPHNVFNTANEIHLPAGRHVQLQLQSSDVIHSFWVPSLSGKKDLVPGHPTAMWLKADRPGVYYGQCAEFCGYQHANMKLIVFVDTPENFAAWQAAQRNPAPEPTTDRQRHGREVFLSRTCVMCHSIPGTTAGSRVGPTLGGLASRRTLGAGALANTTEHLRRWIVDPQSLKPGVRMPQNELPSEDIDALVDYLQTLK